MKVFLGLPTVYLTEELLGLEPFLFWEVAVIVTFSFPLRLLIVQVVLMPRALQVLL